MKTLPVLVSFPALCLLTASALGVEAQSVVVTNDSTNAVPVDVQNTVGVDVLSFPESTDVPTAAFRTVTLDCPMSNTNRECVVKSTNTGDVMPADNVRILGYSVFLTRNVSKNCRASFAIAGNIIWNDALWARQEIPLGLRHEVWFPRPILWAPEALVSLSGVSEGNQYRCYLTARVYVEDF